MNKSCLEKSRIVIIAICSFYRSNFSKILEKLSFKVTAENKVNQFNEFSL